MLLQNYAPELKRQKCVIACGHVYIILCILLNCQDSDVKSLSENMGPLSPFPVFNKFEILWKSYNNRLYTFSGDYHNTSVLNTKGQTASRTNSMHELSENVGTKTSNKP